MGVGQPLLVITILLQQGCVMADFVVKAATDSITVSWDDNTVSGLNQFTIFVDGVPRFTGTNTAKSPYTISDALPGTTFHLMINTTVDGVTTTVLDVVKSTAMAQYDGIVGDNGKVYTLYKNRKSYDEAKAACEATSGGDLITVDSEDKQDVLASLLRRNHVANVWLGAKRTKPGWRWVGSGKYLKFQGCYSDNNNDILKVFISSNSSNTPDSCIVECRNRKLRFAGVKVDSTAQDKVVCKCGDDYDPNLHATSCDNRCPQDQSQKCGSVNAMIIYGVNNAGGTFWSTNEPDNKKSYDPCLVLVQWTYLSYGDVQCFNADLTGYGFFCEYNLTAENCYYTYNAGKCYSTHGASKASWFEARWTCAQNGGELLQVDTMQFFNHLKSTLTTFTWWWIGGSRTCWQWPNGNEMLYSRWASGKPNSETFSCITAGSSGLWEDRNCKNMIGFVCETDGSLSTTKTTTTMNVSPADGSLSTTKTTTTMNVSPADGSLATTKATTTTNASPADSSLASGAIATIVIGMLVLIVIILGIILYFIRRKHSTTSLESRDVNPKELTGEVVLQPVKPSKLDDNHWLFQLREEFIKQKISEQAMADIATEISGIRHVGAIMGFSIQKIQQYQDACPHNVMTQFNSLLMDWLRYSPDVTVRQFVGLMHDAEVDEQVVRRVVMKENANRYDTTNTYMTLIR